MLFLGIDQSLRAPGVAVVGPDGKVLLADVLNVGANLRGAYRLHQIYEFLRRSVSAAATRLPLGTGSAVHLAAIEGPSLGSTHREFDLGEVSGVARLLAFELTGREPLVVPPSQLKKFVAGHGDALKAEMIDAVNLQAGLSNTDDNIADAIGLASLAYVTHTSARPATRKQAEVVKALATPRKKGARLVNGRWRGL